MSFTIITFLLSRMYYLPNIFLQDRNGTWLDGPLSLNNELFSILSSRNLQPISNRVYRLSEMYSYFSETSSFQNPLTTIMYSTRIIYDDIYVNPTTKEKIHRVYASVSENNDNIDGRLLPIASHSIPDSFIRERDIQTIRFTGKLSFGSAQRLLIDYWQNLLHPLSTTIQVSILNIQEYFAPSGIGRFHTKIEYVVANPAGQALSETCWNRTEIQKIYQWCDGSHQYLAEAPISSIPSFVDLSGDITKMDLNHMNIPNLITNALKRNHIDSIGKLCRSKCLFFFFIFNVHDLVTSWDSESRIGLDRSLITRIYYTVMPERIINQEQIADSFKVCLESHRI